MAQKNPYEKKPYQPGKNVLDAKQQLENHMNQKPGAYQSQWKDQADALLGQIQSRDPFFYDAAKDPMYRQAVDQYVRLGRQAMMDTMGQASALTGGYGNSYAQTAAQQSYQGYLQALGMKLPQFHQMALTQYQARGKDLMDRWNALNQREKDAYGQYQKVLELYYAQQDRLQNAYDRLQDRDYHRYEDDRAFAYNQAQDALENERQAQKDRQEQARWEADQAYQKERDRIRDGQWKQEFEENRRRYEQQWAAKHSGGGGGGGGGGSGSGVRNYNRYQYKNGITMSGFHKDRTQAEKTGHTSTRPTGSPWSPLQDPWRRPFRPAIG